MANILETDNISGTGWAPNATSVVTANYATAPDGTMTASRLIDSNGGGGAANVQTSNTFSGASTLALSTPHIYHGYLKTDQLNEGRLQIGGLSTLDLFVLANTDTGTITSTGANITDSGIEPYQDGWYFVWFTFTSHSSDGTGTAIARAGNSTQDQDGTSSILVAGVRLEEGTVADRAYALDNPPVLSSPTATSVTTTSAVAGFTSDDAVGTAYYVAVPQGDNPSIAQIKAGQQSNGTAAPASGNKAAASGAQTFAAATGLTADTAYSFKIVQEDAWADSNVLSVNFTTDAEGGGEEPSAYDDFWWARKRTRNRRNRAIRNR